MIIPHPCTEKVLLKVRLGTGVAEVVWLTEEEALRLKDGVLVAWWLGDWEGVMEKVGLLDPLREGVRSTVQVGEVDTEREREALPVGEGLPRGVGEGEEDRVGDGLELKVPEGDRLRVTLEEREAVRLADWVGDVVRGRVAVLEWVCDGVTDREGEVLRVVVQEGVMVCSFDCDVEWGQGSEKCSRYHFRRLMKVYPPKKGVTCTLRCP